MFIEKTKERMLTIMGVIFIASAMTLLVAIESKWMSWSPYFPIYAILAFWIPYKLGIWRPELATINISASIKHVFRKHWKFILAIFIFVEIWDIVSLNILYNILTSVGLTGIPFDAAINLVAQSASMKFGITTEEALGYYVVFVIGWAPLGESVFYLGYIQKALRKKHSFALAALISASFFAVRHGTHFLFLLPEYPVVAGAMWIISAFVFGLLISWLYERTGSLYPPIAVHLAGNVISIFISA